MTSTIPDNARLPAGETAPRPIPQPITRFTAHGVARVPDSELNSNGRQRALALTALAGGGAYVLWRASATLSPAVMLAGVSFLLLEVWSLISLAGTTLQAWHLNAVPIPKPAAATELSVTVLIPTDDESPDVLLPVLVAATRMRLASEVVVLDDGRREWLVGMCDELGIEYRTRETREGGWAGNVNTALASLTCDVVVVLGADQVAKPDLIGHVLPYFEDPRLGLVHIASDAVNEHSSDAIGRRESPLARLDFEERILARGRNRWNAAYWAAGPAALRMSAIQAIGGVATVTHGQRIRTSIRLHADGWRSVHHGEPLVRGRSDRGGMSFEAGVRSQTRDHVAALFCESSLWRLGSMQRAAYISALTASADRWRLVGYLALPVLMLVLVGPPASSPVATFTVLATATLVLRQVALRAMGRGWAPRWRSATTSVVRLAAGLGRASMAILVIAAVLLLAALLVVPGHWMISGSLPHAETTFGIWASLWAAAGLMLVLRAVARHARAGVPSERRRAPRIDVEGHVFLDGVRVHVLDLSLGGARLLCYGVVPPIDSYCAMTFTDPNRRLAVVTGTVVAVSDRPHGREARIALEPDQTYVLGAILVDALDR
jgi:hypothetical protein